MPKHYARAKLFSLTAIAQAPTVLCVLWDRDAFGVDKLDGKIGANVRAIVGWHLRLTDENGSRRDYAISPNDGRFYICGLIGGEIYRVSLLVEDAVKEKHTMTTCDRLRMPSNNVSDLTVPEFPISRDDFVDLFGDDDNFGASEFSADLPTVNIT